MKSPLIVRACKMDWPHYAKLRFAAIHDCMSLSWEATTALVAWEEAAKRNTILSASLTPFDKWPFPDQTFYVRLWFTPAISTQWHNLPGAIQALPTPPVPHAPLEDLIEWLRYTKSTYRTIRIEPPYESLHNELPPLPIERVRATKRSGRRTRFGPGRRSHF